MTTLTISIIKTMVLAKIGEDLFDTLLHDVQNNRILRLWGMTQPHNFKTHMLIGLLYRDLFGVGYGSVVENVNFGYSITEKSFHTNCKRIRQILRSWAADQIRLGTASEWRRAAARSGLQNPVENANLWIDSSDFRLAGRSSVKKTDPSWSYKENSPAIRVMVVCDGHCRVRKIWGPYSPKVYDGHFVQSHVDQFEELFRGAVFLADNHFYICQNMFDRNIKFLVNFPVRGASDEEPGSLDISYEGYRDSLTRTQVKFNNAHKKARARIESVFGSIMNMFESLCQPWFSDEGELADIIYYACGIHNYKLS
jgi:hypothetical protein